MTVKISVRNLYKSFGRNRVLDGLDLDVETGESLVVLGGSGSGKSVLIKTIIGLLRPNKGSIIFNGQDVTSLTKIQKNEFMQKCGFLFQGGALFDSLPIWQNICFTHLNNLAMDLVKAKDIAIEKLASVGLEERVADLYPSELSGGMQKRAALARAIAMNPEVIFFDEPTTGLDPIMSSIINDIITKNVKKLGATAITITHDIASARVIADRVAMIYEGKIIWHDSIKKLDHSGNAIVDQFIRGRSEGPIQVKLQDHSA